MTPNHSHPLSLALRKSASDKGRISQMPKQSQDVDTPAGNGAVSTPTPFQRLRRRMAEMAIMETASGRPSGEDINAILTADSEEEMWDADELDKYNAQKLSGCDLQATYLEVRFGDGNTEIETPI